MEPPSQKPGKESPPEVLRIHPRNRVPHRPSTEHKDLTPAPSQQSLAQIKGPAPVPERDPPTPLAGEVVKDRGSGTLSRDGP